MRTKGEGAKAAILAEQEYENQGRFFASEATSTKEAITELQLQYRQCLEDLASQVILNAEPAVVAQAAQACQEPHWNQQREHWASRLPAFQSRLELISSDSDLVNRQTLLDPRSGELGFQFEQVKTQFLQAQEAHMVFLEDDFQWVVQREESKKAGVSVFQGFLRAITFAETREKSAKKKLVKKLAASDWEDLYSRYGLSLAKIDQVGDKLETLSKRKKALEALIAEQEDLSLWVLHFERRLTVELQNLMVEALPLVDPMRLRQIPGGHHVTASKAHALRAKLKYLGQLESFLSRESSERHRRAEKIGRVRRLWEAKPWDRLASDKTKWLVTVPALKRSSTEKQVRWSKSMRRGIVEYDNYEDYDYYYSYFEEQDDREMLPYDVFAHGFDEAMPYEGFSAEVLSDIREHRQEHNLEKADYSDFKSLDKEPRDEADENTEDSADSHASDAAFLAVGTVGVVAATVAAMEIEEMAMEAAMLAEESGLEDFADAS